MNRAFSFYYMSTANNGDYKNEWISELNVVILVLNRYIIEGYAQRSMLPRQQVNKEILVHKS